MRILLLLTLVTTSQAAPPPSPELTRDARALLAEACEADGPGIVAVVAREGRSWLELTRGMADIAGKRPLTTATTVDLASVSKAFTAFAILRLADRGALDLDDPIGKHLPELAKKKFSRVKIKHLLYMVSGLPDYTGDVEDYQETTPDQALALVAGYSLDFAPGSAYDYSNTNYMLLARLAEVVSGERFDRWLAKNAFEPLGMADSSVLLAPGPLDPRRAVPYREGEDGWEDCRNDSHLYGDGQVLASARDMVRWAHAWRGSALLPEAMLEKAFTPFRLTGDEESTYAAGWERAEIAGHDAVSHGGSWDGTSTYVLHLLDRPVDVVALSNDEDVDTESLAHELLELSLEP